LRLRILPPVNTGGGKVPRRLIAATGIEQRFTPFAMYGP
jgi:hypothetical protein